MEKCSRRLGSFSGEGREEAEHFREVVNCITMHGGSGEIHCLPLVAGPTRGRSCSRVLKRVVQIYIRTLNARAGVIVHQSELQPASESESMGKLGLLREEEAVKNSDIAKSV